MSILRSFVAVCCSFYKYCCLVWLFALFFWLLFKKAGKINYEGAPPLHVQSFPRACCNLKPIWRSQKLYLGNTMIKQRSKQLLFRLHSTIPRTNTEPRRAVLHTKVHSMVFTYIPTDTVSAQAVTVAETCIISAMPLIQNVPANTAMHHESLGGRVTERLGFWNCNPEAPSLIHSLTACRICPC